MENFFQVSRDRAVIRVRGHNALHERPPAVAFIRIRDRVPQILRFDLRIAKKLACLRIEEDRIVMNTVSLEHNLQLMPDRPMAPLVLVVRVGVNTH